VETSGVIPTPPARELTESATDEVHARDAICIARIEKERAPPTAFGSMVRGAFSACRRG
jgi:hypothetical protein